MLQLSSDLLQFLKYPSGYLLILKKFRIKYVLLTYFIHIFINMLTNKIIRWVVWGFGGKFYIS